QRSRAARRAPGGRTAAPAAKRAGAPGQGYASGGASSLPLPREELVKVRLAGRVVGRVALLALALRVAPLRQAHAVTVRQRARRAQLHQPALTVAAEIPAPVVVVGHHPVLLSALQTCNPSILQF